jgi:hypothetical protein
VFLLFKLVKKTFLFNIDNDIFFEPKILEKFLGKLPSYMYVLQWYKDGEEYKIDFFKKDQIENEIEKLNKEIDKIDSVCPFCEEIFKINGNSFPLLNRTW